MRIAPVCCRCGGPVQPPDLMSSRWRCDDDGEVDPLTVLAPPGPQTLEHVAAQPGAPLWVPWPTPVGWTLAGVAHTCDERSAARASATGWCGPSPTGGVAELVLVAEEPGIGLGAHLAGLPGLDAGSCVDGPPEAQVEIGGHPVALWSCPASGDRAVLVGEANGCWLWLLLWPGEADILLAEHLLLRDARREPVDPQIGAAGLRLVPLTSR